MFGKNLLFILKNQPRRGLRQGDPLSPFLFLFCAEELSAVLRRKEEDGGLHGFRVSSGGVSVSHLLFADDSVVFCHATEEEALGVISVLDQYAEGSGQVINKDKSSSFFGSNCTKRMRKKISRITCIQVREGLGKHLGLQADFGL